MEIRKSFVTLWLSAGLLASLPAATFAQANFVPQNTAAAPAIPATALHQLSWTPVGYSKTQITRLAVDGQPLNVRGIVGPVAAYSVPVITGEITLTLSSEVDTKDRVFAANVLVFDQNMTPSAFFPSDYFTYLQSKILHAERLEGIMHLTPSPGQQMVYILVFTTPQDLQRNTQLINPAKAYARGTGNAVPDIPDPVARHLTDGTLKLRVTTASSASVLVGSPLGSSRPEPVTTGSRATAAAHTDALAAVPQRGPILHETEKYFNQSIKQSVAKGDIDKALKLMNEAEKLGIKSARSTFINGVKGNK